MTILNYPTDGLHPELIALARLVAHSKSINREELIELCAWGAPVRLNGAVLRWTTLGLFVDTDGAITLNKSFAPKRGEALDSWTDRLPSLCRHLTLSSSNWQPLFGRDIGVSADFVKGIAWLLAQDIFSFPTVWEGGVEQIQLAQIREKIIQNDTRWNGLRFWARYLGFATGDARSFMIDPTRAIGAELGHFKNGESTIPARTFLTEIAAKLPVLDGGDCREEVERHLDQSIWPRPATNHLSMSLSFALRRLELDHVIALERRADAADAAVLTGMGFQSKDTFTHVRLLKVSA